MTQPGAMAFAREISLRASDGPEWAATSPERVRSTAGGWAGFACPRASDHAGRLAAVVSPVFVSHGERFNSEIEVMRSDAFAVRNIAAHRSGSGRACLVRFVGALRVKPRSSAFRNLPVKVAALPTAVSGVPGSFELRFTIATIAGVPNGEQFTLSEFVDVLGFVDGPADVNLVVISERQPASSEAEQYVLAKLYRRAQADKPS